jgi:hypothetical protein
MAIDMCHVVNIVNMGESWVWPSEAVGRNLHYYPDLSSGFLLHRDLIASLVLFMPLDTDKVSTFDRK